MSDVQVPQSELIEPDLQPRRRPVQQRSKERYARILQTARDRLLKSGLEALTSELIAADAELPVGTVYQFFPNKFAIVCELNLLDTVSITDELDTFATKIPTPDWQELLEVLIDHLAEAWSKDPSRRAVWYAMQATHATRHAASVHQQMLVDRVIYVLSPLTPKMAHDERETIAQVVVHTVYSMLNFSVRDDQPHPAAVTETKRMILSYLEQSATYQIPEDSDSQQSS